MRYSLLSILSLPIILASCGDSVKTYPDAVYQWEFDSAHAQVAQYVDPFIGTGGHGHTFPGATAPFGMVQLSPDTRIDGSWDGCSGYHHDDHRIYGFSHTHLSGTGCSDYGDIMLMPGHGEMQFAPGSDTTSGYSSTFTHEVEHASAGYYSVELDNKITCELTASPRVGVHRYSFNDNSNPWLVLDMSHRDMVLDCEIEIVDDHTIRGKRFSKAWATNQQLWFYAEFSEPFTHTFWSDGKTFSTDSSHAKDLKAVLSFDSKQVEVKVALSPVSCANAKMNLDVETADMNFDAVKAKTEQHWNSELSCIEIETADETKKRIFYTALYHCFIAPNVYCDVNGDYQGMDHKVYRDTVHQRYTVFSLWDTYRALHPLFTIVQQKRTNDFINTFLQIYKESGRLPVWELSSNETDCMIGYHSVSVIADAWMKGIVDYDTALAYEAMKASAMENRFGLEDYRSCGFIPAEKESESVSRTLEYAYDDWCIAQCGFRMKDDWEFMERSMNWRNLYNPESGFLQARMNNSFFSPFNPFEVNNNYTEANAWQYSLAVQHDPMGLVKIMGGPEKFEAHLDSLFTVSSKTSGREQADITGLIGQYAHGNEPSHHMAYLYCYINKFWKTQELVHRICKDLYSDKPDGLCGNEDCGQMSAWYVMSASGLYAVTPGRPEFVVGSPLFKSVKYHLENGKTFEFTCMGTNPEAPYMSIGNDTAELNRMPQRAIIPFSEIQQGWPVKQIKFTEPLKSCVYQHWPKYHNSKPVTPWVAGVTSRTFTDKLTLQLQTLDSQDEVKYSINDSPFIEYKSPFSISENSTIRMYTYDRNYELGPTMGRVSDTATAVFFKAPSWKSISIRNAFAPQYSAGGDRALIDGLTGTTNFRTGLWQGYEGKDLEVVIDLGKEMEVDSIIMNFLNDENAWIFRPHKVIIVVANDTFSGNDYMRMPAYSNFEEEPSEPSIYRVATAGGKGRYVRVLARSQKQCPAGHPGAGKPAWLFADEITIKTK